MGHTKPYYQFESFIYYMKTFLFCKNQFGLQLNKFDAETPSVENHHVSLINHLIIDSSSSLDHDWCEVSEPEDTLPVWPEV